MEHRGLCSVSIVDLCEVLRDCFTLGFAQLCGCLCAFGKDPVAARTKSSIRLTTSLVVGTMNRGTAALSPTWFLQLQ